tara:strand:+ start:2154 stop:2321 length:168 start_codon:yes stop_codon:yes gene_type:complete
MPDTVETKEKPVKKKRVENEKQLENRRLRQKKYYWRDKAKKEKEITYPKRLWILI